MNRFLLAIVSTASTVLVMGCAGGIGNDLSAATLVQIDDIATGPKQTHPAIVEIDGKLAVLHATKNDRVALQIGDKRQLLDETARVKQGGSYFQLHSQDKNLDALWWSHQDGKNIYLTSSADGGKSFAPVSMVNDQHGVLPPFSLVREGQRTLGVAYHDERLPGFQAFFNRSLDGGQTWIRPDVRLDAPAADSRSTAVHEPQIVQIGKTWLSAWTDEVMVNGKMSYRIVSRHSVDAGVSWSAPEVLFSASHQISSLIVRTNETHIVIAADALNEGIFCLTSSDEGRSWQNSAMLAGTDGASSSGIDMVLLGSRAHLVWMQERKEQTLRIMRASWDFKEQKWLDAAQRLDIKASENTRSTSPVIVATTTGTLVSAWVDYRDIRPNIYLSASYDVGQTWQAPQALLSPGTQSAGWPQLIRWGDQVALAYEAYPQDVTASGHLMVKNLSVGSSATGLLGMANISKFSETERKTRLENRVKTLWENRIKADYASAYDMFDFAYKAATPKKYYLDNVGVITYLAFNVEDIAVEGNVAAVKTKLKYEVKPMILPTTGKPIKLAAVEVDSPNTWVWVGDDWYLVYAPSIGPAPLSY